MTTWKNCCVAIITLLAAAAPSWADLPQRPCAAEPAVTDMIYGEIITCKIDVAGDHDSFRFTGTAGQWIDVYAYRTGGGGDHCLDVLDPDGNSMGSGCVGYYSRPALNVRGYTLTKNGTYRINVWDNGDNETLDYSVLIHQTFPASARVLPIAFGLPQSNKVTFLDKQVYSFEGSVSDKLAVRAVRTDGGADHCIRLIEPDGVEAVGATCVGYYSRPATTSFNWQVRKRGTHYIEVFDNGWDESFSFNLWVDCDGLCPAGTTPEPTKLRFVPVTPCRIADTRLPAGQFGGPRLTANESRSFAIPSSTCNIPSAAAAYSVNVTVVPPGPLAYLTLWPTGQQRPFVSTLNSTDGRIKANAAIVPSGTNGGVSVFVTDATDVILDINGYFIPASSGSNLAFYPLTPCRIADTRNANGAFGGPRLAAGQSRTFNVPQSACSVPSTAQAYSLNFTAVPQGNLGYLTTWPAGQGQPYVSTLNSPKGGVVANAAIVPAGTSGGISVYVTDPSDVVVDINGYFAPPGSTGELSLYTLSPCRVADTRNANGGLGGPVLTATQTRAFPVAASSCGVPAAAQAYSLNATVVPDTVLGYLSLWPTGVGQPLVSTLNSPDGSIVANAAIVPAGSDKGINAFVTNKTHLILDINGYFAP